MKANFAIPDFGIEVAADLTKLGRFAVHESLGGRGGYAVTEVATGRLAAWRRLKAEAVEVRDILEGAEIVSPELLASTENVTLERQKREAEKRRLKKEAKLQAGP